MNRRAGVLGLMYPDCKTDAQARHSLKVNFCPEFQATAN